MIITTLLLTSLSLVAEPVTMDGSFEDWPAPPNSDGWSIQGTTDRDSLFLRVHHPGPRRVMQQLDEPMRIGLDLDNQLTTGMESGAQEGCELVFELSPAGKTRTRGGVTARTWNTTSNSSPYRYGFVAAPSTASRSHEFKINRDTLGELPPVIRVILAPGNEAPVAISMDTRPRRPTARRVGASVPRLIGNGVRFVSWNIERGGMLKRSDLVKSILEELKPDVLLIQELEDDQQPGSIQAFLEEMEPGHDWNVVMSPAGSGLRTAVASRLPATELKSFDRVARSDNPRQAVRVSGLLVEDNEGSSTLAISIHLKCCGGLNGKEDMTRISEMLSIREAIELAVQAHQPAGLVIGGDFNLVASPVPLDILRMGGQSLLGADREGDLVVAEAMHLDRCDSYTWYNAGSQFTPGRLDFVLTGGDLDQTRAFVLDTADLQSGKPGDLPMDATETASDHLPVVVDVKSTR